MQTHSPGISVLLPLFTEKAASVGMVKHGMDILLDIIDRLNEDQVAVMAFDQPLFALAKYIQWCWPDKYGEQMFVTMLGGLHTEMNAWKTVGDLLDGSGWTSALSESGVTTA